MLTEFSFLSVLYL